MDVRVKWDLSPSTDVVVQKLEWLVNGESLAVVNLAPTVTEAYLSEAVNGASVGEGDVVQATITVNDGFSDSPSVTGETKVPLVPPEPVANVVVELV
jgi:hypothetical protein